MTHASATAELTDADHSQGQPREFLTFTLGNEEYGIDILCVQEIRGYEGVTRLPGAPSHIKGVVNIRGTIVPVVDLRIRFQLGSPTYNALTVMVVLNVGDRIVGVVVDSVSDVAALAAEQIRPNPDLEGAVDGRFVTGIGALDDRMLILLDIEGLMASAEMGLAGSEAA
ncbi:chemotaxis protein CheW [Lysobacter olei]